MNYFVKHMTRNDCYTAGRKITPKGVVIHSTATPSVMAATWFDRWNKSFKAGEINRQVCAHGFVDDKDFYEYLPINPEKKEAHRSWLHGGAANNTHLGFEMCEPAGFTYKGSTQVGYDVKKNEEYFNAVYKNAVDICAKWCKEFDIEPIFPNIIDHAEGAKLGVCSASADVGHWFPKHGKSMDMFRADVAAKLKGEKPMVKNPTQPKNLRKGDKGSDVKEVQKKLISHGYNISPYGADGSFGDITEKAVKEFQKAKGLTEDGIVGVKTMAELNKQKAKTQSVATEPKRVLRNGHSGNEVRWVQQKLVELGYSVGGHGVDGSYGPATESAVKTFQKDYRLAVDGVFGPASLAMIKNPKKPNPYTAPVNAVFRRGSRGNGVKWVQTVLLMTGFSMSGYGVDGSYGSATEKAVIAYQRSRGLKVDGITGPATLAAMRKE